MILKKMTATFGALEHATLEFHDGLNVIALPNEGGKSTWCAFLRAMLYGIPTRGKGQRGELSEKHRYLPWSGSPMAGEIDLTWEGRDITLRRYPKGTNPFGGFEAVDSATGLEIADITADNCGEMLVGVGREVYQRSAFLGQSGAKVDADPELEKRIAALVSSGEEEVSYSQVEKALKAWLRRRKYNKSGLIPQLEEEVRQVEGQLEQIGTFRRQIDANQGQIELLRNQLSDLEQERDLYIKREKWEADERVRQGFRTAREDLEASRQALAQSHFSGREPSQIIAQAQSDLEQVERLQRGLSGLWGLLGAPVGCGLGILGAKLAGGPPFQVLPLLFGAVLGWLLATVPILAVKRRRQAQAKAILDRYHVAAPEDILPQATDYAALVDNAKEAQWRYDTAKFHYDQLPPEAQGDAPPPAPARYTAAQTAAAIAAGQNELSRLERDTAALTGRLSALDSPEALTARREELRQALARRQTEYDALVIALEALAEANEDLQARFSPALNRRAGEIFSALTGGRYDTLTLTRSFEAQAREAGDIQLRPAPLLSQGTLDQLYLAVRLAVCELALPNRDPVPLVLDDALASFDDTRMALALDFLKGLDRQILLFTCHSRERAYLEYQRAAAPS